VFQGEVLVSKLVAVDGLSPGSVVVGEVTALRVKNKRVQSAGSASEQEPESATHSEPAHGPELTWHMKSGMMRWKPQPL